MRTLRRALVFVLTLAAASPAAADEAAVQRWARLRASLKAVDPALTFDQRLGLVTGVTVEGIQRTALAIQPLADGRRGYVYTLEQTRYLGPLFVRRRWRETCDAQFRPVAGSGSETQVGRGQTRVTGQAFLRTARGIDWFGAAGNETKRQGVPEPIVGGLALTCLFPLMARQPPGQPLELQYFYGRSPDVLTMRIERGPTRRLTVRGETVTGFVTTQQLGPRHPTTIRTVLSADGRRILERNIVGTTMGSRPVTDREVEVWRRGRPIVVRATTPRGACVLLWDAMIRGDRQAMLDRVDARSYLVHMYAYQRTGGDPERMKAAVKILEAQWPEHGAAVTERWLTQSIDTMRARKFSMPQSLGEWLWNMTEVFNDGRRAKVHDRPLGREVQYTFYLIKDGATWRITHQEPGAK